MGVETQPETTGAARPFGDRPEGLRFLVASVLGLSFFWQFFRFSRVKSLFLFLPDESLATTFACSAYVVMLAAAVLPLVSRKDRGPSRIATGALSCAAAAANLCALFALPHVPEEPGATLSAVPIAVLNGAAALALLHAWGEAFARSRLNLRTLMEALCLSFLCSFALAILCLPAQPLDDCLSASMLFLSAAGLNFVGRQEETRAARPRRDGSLLSDLPVRLFASIVGLLVVAIAIGGTTSSFVAGDGLTPYAVHGCTVALSIALLLACLFSTSFTRLLYTQWLLAALAFVAGLLLMAFGGERLFTVGVALSTAGRAVFELTLFVMCALNPRQQNVRLPAALMLFFVLPETLGTLLGRMVVPAILTATSVPAPTFITSASVAMGVLLLMCLIAWLGGNALAGIEARNRLPLDRQCSDGASADDSEARLAALLTDRYCLTKRESEIALLLSRGYNYQKVSDVVSLSKGTVQSHAKSIYHKLGVHSRQELIDVLEALG